jgi:hypothetical protein
VAVGLDVCGPDEAGPEIGRQRHVVCPDRKSKERTKTAPLVTLASPPASWASSATAVAAIARDGNADSIYGVDSGAEHDCFVDPINSRII